MLHFPLSPQGGIDETTSRDVGMRAEHQCGFCNRKYNSTRSNVSNSIEPPPPPPPPRALEVEWNWTLKVNIVKSNRKIGRQEYELLLQQIHDALLVIF